MSTMFYLLQGKPFPEETLRLWLAQLLLAVDYMHRQSVLHRDIKTQVCAGSPRPTTPTILISAILILAGL